MPFPHRKFRAKRDEFGWSRVELAEVSGVDVRTLEALEQGRRPNPTQDTLEKLSTALGVTCEFFFSGDIDPTPKSGGGNETPPPAKPRGRPRKDAASGDTPAVEPKRGRVRKDGG